MRETKGMNRLEENKETETETKREIEFVTESQKERREIDRDLNFKGINVMGREDFKVEEK